jgi:microcystin-dependent protein
MPWITPDGLPDSLTDFRVIRLPANVEFAAAVHGALLGLTRAWNWEQWGDSTPEECAALAAEMLRHYLEENALRVGDVWATERTDTPDYALACDGQIVSILDYPELFDVLGVRYGGDGVSTFATPDYRARAIVGVGSGIGPGDMFGAATVSLSVGELPIHSHSEITAVLSPGLIGEIPSPGVAVPGIGTTGSTGTGAAHENRPPSVGVRWLIKAL